MPLGTQQGSEQHSSGNSYDDGGIVLTARDETWDVSIEDPNRLEETLANDNHLMRVQMFDVSEEGPSLACNVATSGRKKGSKTLFGNSDILGAMTWTSWSLDDEKR